MEQGHRAGDADAPPVREVAAESARAQVARITSSRTFENAPVLRHFLDHITDYALAGKTDQLKEYTLGVDVFARGTSFDPRVDTIVRVQARRLRAKLEEYYRVEGQADAIIVGLPKGHYVPGFRLAVPEREGAPVFQAAEPRAVDDSADSASHADGELNGQAPWLRVNRLTMAALGVAVAAIVAAQWIRARSAPASPVDSLSLEWRTNTGDVYGPAISRDGTYLAYIWLTPGEGQGLRVRQVVGGHTIDVIPPGPVNYWGLKFSPRGDFLYYLIADRASHSLGTLFRIPTLGGRPERVLENVNGHIAPSPNGESVTIVRNNAAPGLTGILTVPSAGGPARTLMTLEWPVVVQALEWAPDGRSLLCALKRWTPAGDRWHVMEIPAAGGSPNVILPPRQSKIISAAWLPERRGFLLTAIDPDSGRSQIWRVSYPDGAERRLTDDLHDYKDLTATADGRTVVAQSLGHLLQIWIARGGDGGEAKQIASGTVRGAYDALAWTADSQLLYKWGERSGYDVWRMAADGSARHQITVNAREISDTSVAPDGRSVFFVSTRGGSRQIWRMRPDGEELRQLTQVKSLVSSPIAAADGNWVYFTADERGFPTLWKMTIDGQSIREVSDKAIELFDLSPDGKRLAYSYRDSHRERVRVAIVALDGSASAKNFDIEPTFALKWTPDGQGLAFAHDQGNIWIQPVSGGPPYAATRQHPGFEVVTFAWSPDARYLAYTLMASPVDAIAFKLQ